MIYLVGRTNSTCFESLKNYFNIKRFNDFNELFKDLNDLEMTNYDPPLSIISDETINNISVYDILKNDLLEKSGIRIPLFIIKENLEGFEYKFLQQGLVDDYINCETKAVDLVERIRFYLMLHQEQGNLKTITSNNQSSRKIESAIQRSMEISGSLFLLILFSPVLMIIALIIKLESTGPIFYVSYRAGTGYNIFKIFKFRTMVNGADALLDKYSELNQYQKSNHEATAFVKLSNDPRVTRIGNFLRKSSIDELPQLINVILGDMSLIGNRPLPLYEAKRLTSDRTAERFSAPAGISGLWQVRKRGKSEMSEDERINLDVEYARNFSLLYDIKIFFQTFPALLQTSQV